MAFEGFKRLFSGDDEYYEEDSYEESTPEPAPKKQAPKKPMTAFKKAGQEADELTTRIALFEPKVYADSRAIASQVIEGDAVIVNFSQLDEEQAMRILDYIGGAVYAVSGSMERVGEKIFLLTPANYSVSGSMSENLDNQSRY
ncbi:cell division protein SepF [Fructobacillus ficulneus]|uniref:Cell division protein SepF n=1 Tax=Fructobacillus ficulneus TaxID=157463 RepID=A0A0K8MJP9_9LACO|nr:cell division protein SepF [Fructobacillus ficulneus]GAP00095.1 FtsZ-interacting protein [Fructobacillus ficulneus]